MASESKLEATTRSDWTVVMGPVTLSPLACSGCGVDGCSLTSTTRIAAGLLCVRAFCSALLVLQASDACPGAFQIIAHCDVQRAAAFTGELDVVAVHERIEPSMIGAGCENVAGVQRVNRGDPFSGRPTPGAQL